MPSTAPQTPPAPPDRPSPEALARVILYILSLPAARFRIATPVHEEPPHA